MFMPVSRRAIQAVSVALLILSMTVAASGQSVAGSQAQVTDNRLMTDADYRTFLLQVEAALPKWEAAALKNIAPERVQRTSYAPPKALIDIGGIRLAVAEQRAKRTVSGELALSGFMRSLYEMGKVISSELTVMSRATDSRFDFGPELSALEIRIDNDVNARVLLLEKGDAHCQPTAAIVLHKHERGKA